MELNEEVVKKSLDWLDSLVGNSNDSDIALFTYQLLGILYDTCEELTEENEAWQKQLISQEEKSSKAYYDLACEVENLRAENEKLIASRDMWMSTAYCEKDRVNSIKADTVRKMQDRFAVHYGTYTYDDKVKLVEVFRVIDKIAREMLEGG